MRLFILFFILFKNKNFKIKLNYEKNINKYLLIPKDLLTSSILSFVLSKA
jgi:hypothetical protein